MIKKTITIAVTLILSAVLIWAAWEGNAIAGSQEEFPSGLFAFSDLFPKYTLVEIVNLEQNTTSRAVIIESTGTEGMLVKVSPDLAAALAIKMGNTVRVRGSVPPLVAEEGADPVLLGKNENELSASAVTPSAAPASVKQATEAYQITPAKQIQPERAPREVSEPVSPASTSTAAKKKPRPAVEVAEPVKPEDKTMPYVALPTEVSEPLLPEPETAQAPSAVSDVNEPVAPSVQSEDLAEARKPVLVAALIQEPPVQGDAESSDEQAKSVPEATEIPAPEEPVQVAEVAPVSDAAPIEENTPTEEIAPVEEVAAIEEPEAAPVEDAQPIAEPEETSEPTPVEDAQPIEDPEVFATEQEETQPEQTDELKNEPEVVLAEEVPTDNNDTEEESVEKHVMLVPTAPKAPVSEDIPPSEEPAKPAPAAVAVVTQPAQESYTTDALKKGSFYVQIGRFKDMLNVESFVQLYGEQYPVTVEKAPAAKGTDVFYRVYIGPLQKDERGATLETFQKLGFKDAFLKKAP